MLSVSLLNVKLADYSIGDETIEVVIEHLSAFEQDMKCLTRLALRYKHVSLSLTSELDNDILNYDLCVLPNSQT